MWKRLKTKVLLKPPGSATRTSLLHHLSSCSDTTDERSLNDYDPSEPDDPDLIRDSRKMSFPYLDKCSCGSPGLNAKDGVRRTGSLRRKNNLITEINRKNDGGVGRKESCETAKNEYTRPESLFEERRKGSTTSTPAMMSTTTATTTTAMMMTTTPTTTTTTVTATTTSAGYTPTGIRRGDEERSRNPQQVVSGRKPGSVQRSSTGLDDSEEDSDDEDAQSSSESGGSTVQQPRESAGSSDYTSLAFDVNYVRVSPPKMTRRQKPVETKKKPSRGSLLSGLRTTEAPPAGGSGSGGGGGESEKGSGKQPPRDLEGPSGKAEGPVDATKGPFVLVDRKGKAERTLKESPEEPISENRKPVSMGIVPRSVEKAPSGSPPEKPLRKAPSGSLVKETEYISLQDLQMQIQKPAKGDPLTAPGVDAKTRPSMKDPGSKSPKTSPDASSSVVDLMGPLVDDPTGDSVTLFQDGDSSVLEFTFTVRLENDVIRRIRPEDSAVNPDSNTGSPVVSGSVNIMKTDNATLSVLKPVITVGLRNVTVDGTKAADHDGCTGARRKLPDADTVPSKHLADRHQLQQQQPAREYNAEVVSQTANNAKPPLQTSEGGRPRRGYDATLGRSASESRGSLADGVKTVTWAFDRSSTAATQPPYRVETSSKETLDSERSPFARKQQTLADFISSHQTKITTVAIVHKSADFDETTDPGGDNVDSISRPSDRKQATGSGSSPATSGHSNKSTPTEGNRGLRASTQVVKEPELTHMSWEEVMKEAKALGIPLARPGSATRQQQQQLQHHHQAQQQRRSSVSSTTTDSAQMSAVVDAKMTSSWVCPTCCPEATTMTSATTSRRAAREAEKTKKGSPFKEKFKLQNLFCRKQKDDDGGKTTTTIKNNCKAQQHQQQNHPHHHQHHQQHQHPFQTMPPGCAGRATSSIEDSCCLRCVSASKGGGGGGAGGGAGHHPGKTPMSPSRLQSPLRMSFFSGTTTAKKSLNGSDGNATVHRTGCQWNSPPGKNNNKGLAGTFDTLRDNANSNSDSSTLSPRQKPGNNQDFLKSLEQLKNCGWYWGPLGFEEAEVRLTGRPDGAFLVRDSSDDRYILSLSFRSQGTTHHTRIEHFRGMFSFYAQQNIHEASTIVEFIENAMRHSQEGKCLYYLRPRSPSAAPAPVQLLYPVSRFLGVFSLKHLAQAAVLSHLRRPDLIDRLPLASAEKESLRRHQHSRRQRAGP